MIAPISRRRFMQAIATVPVPNAALTLRNLGSNLTGGNAANSLSLRLFYRITPAAPFG